MITSVHMYTEGRGIKFPGVGVTSGCKLLMWALGLELRSSGEAVPTVTAEPSL